MKQELTPSKIQMEPEAFKMLVSEVKETIALDYDMTGMQKNAFNALNLWKINRDKKSARSTFRKWTII
jgi:hypothetical protein